MRVRAVLHLGCLEYYPFVNEKSPAGESFWARVRRD